MGEQVIQRAGLTRIEPVLPGHHITANGDLTPRFHLVQLRGQSTDEKLQPTGQVDALLAHTLNRPVESAPISVIEFAGVNKRLKS